MSAVRTAAALDARGPGPTGHGGPTVSLCQTATWQTYCVPGDFDSDNRFIHVPLCFRFIVNTRTGSFILVRGFLPDCCRSSASEPPVGYQSNQAPTTHDIAAHSGRSLISSLLARPSSKFLLLAI